MFQSSLYTKAKGLWDNVGNTPIELLEELSRQNESEIYVTMESQNPTGSIKDRGGMFNILSRIKAGEVSHGHTLFDASSGNMASSIAYHGRRLGLPVTVVCSSRLTRDKESYIRALGAKIIIHGSCTMDGNKLCRSLSSEDPKLVFLDQLHSDYNPLGSFSTLGPEILKSLPDVDVIVASLGSGGSLYGLSWFINIVRPKCKFVPITASRGSRIPGVSGDYMTPFIHKANQQGLWCDRISISEDQALKSMDAIHKTEGIYAGKQLGALAAALPIIVRDHGRGLKILLICGDHGWKNSVDIDGLNPS